MTMRTVAVEWSDIKRRYLGAVSDGERWNSQPHMDERLRAYYRNPYKVFNDGGGGQDDWEGGTPAQTCEWARNGFRAEAFLHSAKMVPNVLKRRAVWNTEDGDIDPGRLFAGRDDFFLGSQKRESKPGLHIQAEWAFAWTVESSVLEAYGAWLAGLIRALESSGFDLTVDLLIPLNELFVGDREGERTNILIRVKRQNEISDFTEWSALFAPTGYRHLGFTAHCVAGDQIGRTVAPYFGMTIGGKTWGVDYDREDQTVMVTINQRAGGRDAFPKDRLNQEAIKCGLLPDPKQLTNDWRKPR